MVGGRCWWAEGFDRVVGSAGVEAVVELAEHAVEQVSQGGGVSITVGFAVVVVVFGWSGSGQGGEGPEESDGARVGRF